MNLNVTRSPRWRLHETASPRRRRCCRQRAHVPHEGVAVVSRRRRSHTGHTSDLPEWYRCAAPSGKRTDRFERPELASCSVDYLVRGDYCARPVQEPVAVVVLDLSFDDQCLKDIVGDVLDVVPHSKLSKLGLVTFFGDEAHAWRKSREDGSNAACCVVREGFCAVPSHQWLGTRDVFAKTCAAALEAAPSLRNAALVLQGVHGCRTALECALDGLRETGGRVFLVSRSSPKGLDPTTSLLCNSVHVAVDAFWLDSEGRDQPRFARELGELCRATGGLLHYTDAIDLDQFRRDFTSATDGYFPSTDEVETGVQVIDKAEGCHTAHEATLKVRCSTGLRVQQIYGVGCSLSKDELTISSVRAATTFCVDLERFVNFEAGKRIYVQCALLYSVRTRRLRETLI